MTRRDFLKVLGISPIVALTSGVSQIGIKNPPINVPVYNARRIPTVCTFCAVGCGIIATVANGKVINTEGAQSNPLSERTLYPRALIQRMR